MAEIFISYAREDRETAEALARAFNGRGWSVWWDRNILGGQEFDDAIQQALSSASCVVVLWSSQSVTSRWVRTEAEEAAKKKSLVPVRIEDIEIPLAFRLVHTLPLLNWNGDAPHPDLERVCVAIQSLLTGKAPEVPVTSGQRWRLSRRVGTLLLLALPTVLAGILIVWLMNWRLPTHVQVDVRATSAGFRIVDADSPSQPIVLLAGVGLHSITFEKFSSVRMEGVVELEIADTVGSGSVNSLGTQSSWRRIAVNHATLEFSGESKRLPAALTLENATAETVVAGTLDRVSVQPGAKAQVFLRGKEALNPTLEIYETPTDAFLSSAGLIQVTATNALLKGVSSVPELHGQEQVYRVRRGSDSAAVHISGLPEGLHLDLVLSPKEANTFFSIPGDQGIPISGIEFSRLTETGQPISTLAGTGHISYPEFPSLPAREITAPVKLTLDKLTSFRILEMRIEPEQNDLFFRLDGEAGVLTTTSGAFPVDHRLTKFETLWHRPRLGVWLAFLVWVSATTAGVFRMYKELGR